MGLWRFVLLIALVVGSVLPHCATATPTPATAAHHAAMGHDDPRPSTSHASDACIGCATPTRFALALPAEQMTTTARYVVLHEKLRTRFTALDPPPPRPAA